MPVNPTLNSIEQSTLADFTRPELLVPSLRERDTPGIINELSQALQRQGFVPDMLPFYHAALNQELLGASVVQSGIAFPHARLSGIRQLQFALGRLPEPVVWGSRNCGAVQLVFLIAVPATDGANYLHLLAALARLGQQWELLQKIKSAPNSDSILAALQQIGTRHG